MRSELLQAVGGAGIAGVGAQNMREVFEFNGFRLDKAGPLLTHGVQPLEIAPKALEILTVLVSNAGFVVSKDDLMSVVWPNTVVEEGNIAVHISSLRKALTERGGRADYIQTVSKRGYRFTAPARRTIQVEAIAPNEVSQLFPIAEHYLQQHTGQASRMATAIYQRCVEANPRSGKARAGLADSLLSRFIRGDLGRHEGADAAMELLSEAGAIDPDSPEVHLSLSRLYCVLGWQWERAMAEVQRAFGLATDDATKNLAQAWHGVYLARLGDVDQGVRQLQQACSTIPLNPLV
jgi:DNA-binding winged helix-turn-helix (wHTH) protein